MKDVHCFNHDSNAHRDPKCSSLISEYGYEGYGVYWSIIELMYEQGGRIKKFPKLLDGLAYEFSYDRDKLAKLIEAMLQEFELLLQDDKYIWSDRVLREVYENRYKHDIRANAGSLGGVKSGVTRRGRSKTKHGFEANEAKRSKKNVLRNTSEGTLSTNINNIVYSNKDKPSNKEIPPTIESVKVFFGDDVMAEDFFDYYNSNGWRVGKVPMKDWEACARRWKKNNFGVPASKTTYTKAQQHTFSELERLNKKYGQSTTEERVDGDVQQVSGLLSDGLA